MSKNSPLIRATAVTVIAMGIALGATPAASAKPVAPTPPPVSKVAPDNTATALGGTTQLTGLAALIDRLLRSPNCNMYINGVQYCR